MRPPGSCRRPSALQIAFAAAILALLAVSAVFAVSIVSEEAARAAATPSSVLGSEALGAEPFTPHLVGGEASGAEPSGAEASGGEPSGEIAPLAVTVDRVLSLLTESVTVHVAGDLERSLIGAELVILVKGPADVSQIPHAAAELPEADKLVAALGSTAGSTAGTATTAAVLGGTDEELASGALFVAVSLPAQRPEQPGAYLLAAEVRSGTEVIAKGQTWIGRAAPRETPLDLAFVWPVSLGIHRDASGVFYDEVLEKSLGSAAAGDADGGADPEVGGFGEGGGGRQTGSLPGVASLADRFPGWNFTLAVEPVLLAQLRDMADGYTKRGEADDEIEVAAEHPVARGADALLAALKDASARGSVGVVVSPYSGADLAVLAAEGWRDGFEQIQLGKQELEQTLSLGAPLRGAFSPDLNLSSDSLSSYADASVDHVVVDRSLAAMLTEPVEPGTVAVRARNEHNDRVTLVFAETAFSSLLALPSNPDLASSSDPDLFFVMLAAELAAVPRNAIVAAPRMDFALVPDQYFEGIGRTLAGLNWVRTKTLSELLRAYSPGTRPVMLKTGGAALPGYIEATILETLRSAHAVVTDLAEAAGPTRAPVETAYRLLYTAESRWWWRDGTSPAEASMGLEYALMAKEIASTEFNKVRFDGADSGLIAGREGSITLSVENAATYPMTAEVQLSATGLSLPDGESIEIELQPGRTEIPVQVIATDGEHKMAARLVAGRSIIDELAVPVRFVTVRTLLPALIVGGFAVFVGLFFLLRRLLEGLRIRTRRPHRRRRPAWDQSASEGVRGLTTAGASDAHSAVPSGSAAGPAEPSE